MAGKQALVAYEEPRAGEDAEERTTAHPFFLVYWAPRGGKREALIWAKDEPSALGLLQSAVPGADVVEVEQREVEPGMRRGKNVYAMGGEAMETEASEYVAVDSRGRKVFGPSKDYEQAKRHAAQAGGVVHFVMGAVETAGAGEGPHSAPSAAPSGHVCTQQSATEIAQQIPGGPWHFVKSYPKEAQARVDRQQDFDVQTPAGRQRVTAYFCGGKNLMLRCPAGTQFLFEAACVGDVPGKPAAVAPHGVQAKPGHPYIIRVKRGAKLLVEGGPYATPTEAMRAIEILGSKRLTPTERAEKGDLAGIYKDGKLIDFRGGRAAYSFGRTRWSRA